MLLVVDTNVSFSFFKRDSFTRKIILADELDLISPKRSWYELHKYSEDLASKSKIVKVDLDSIFSQLPSVIKFIPLQEYISNLRDALELVEEFPNVDNFADDIDFFALALNKNCSIWSNDKLFKQQSSIKVFNTEELEEYLMSLGYIFA